MLIKLLDFMPNKDGDGWGTSQGRKVHELLNEVVEKSSKETIFTISLEGIRHTDVSFVREGVVSLAKRYRGSKGFCLTNLGDRDLRENWDSAATRLEQPIILWNGNEPDILGPQPSPGTREMLDYVLGLPVAYTSEAAANFDLKVPNASNKLKLLWQEGYILQRKRAASSGGVEFEYYRIR